MMCSVAAAADLLCNRTLLGNRRERLTMRVAELAQALGVSKRHLAALDSSGRLPKALKLGRCKIWIREEIEDWLRAGAPARDKWEAKGKRA